MNTKSLISELDSLKKTKKKLIEDIQNLEKVICGTDDYEDSEDILIPGKNIPRLSKKNDSDQSVYYIAGKSKKAPKFSFKKFNSDVLITPIVATRFDPNTQTIIVDTVAFVNKKQNVKHFELSFNYTLSEAGKPQLSIYICYNAPEVPARKYMIHPFEIIFTKDSVDNGSKKIVPLHSIKTVKIFLVNTDPKTSRGTMTTVQPGA